MGGGSFRRVRRPSGRCTVYGVLCTVNGNSGPTPRGLKAERRENGDGKTPPCPGIEGMRSVEIFAGVYEAARTGEKVELNQPEAMC